MLRWLGIVLAVLVLLVLSGLLLADHLTPKAMGAPSSVLPVQPAQTVIDRELTRLQASHPTRAVSPSWPTGWMPTPRAPSSPPMPAAAWTCSTTSGTTT